MLLRPGRRLAARAVLVTTLAALTVVGAAGCATTTDGRGAPAGASGGRSSSSPSSSAAVGAPVHVSTVQGDNQTYGVGEPIIARFTPAPTSSVTFTNAAQVTVNGAPAGGAWFWEKPYADGPIEAHYRPPSYWPAHSQIHMNLPLKGLSAGPGLVYADNLTLDFTIGAKHVSTVDGQALTMSVASDDVVQKTFQVSLGKANTPTFNGTKVVMDKKNPQRMIGDGKSGPSSVYNELVPFSVRVTLSGEFIHAAAWNTGNIGSRSTSNGCTNLTVGDAEWFYNFAQLGDVAVYTGTTGGPMPPLDGLGDWNVRWDTWKGGGLLRTH